MTNNKIKFSKNTEFWVKVVIDEYVDNFGRRMIKTQWQKQEGDLNMGSVKNPQNKQILAVKWVEKQDPNRDEFDLRKLFGGFGGF